MTISLIHLLAFDGPNRYSPQPGVYIQLTCEHDCSNALRQCLKDAAQQVGLVLAYLNISVVLRDGCFVIEAGFTTPTPALGALISQYSLEVLRAEEHPDQEWDAEEPLWLLQKQRRREALPLQALQLLAEATRRGIPTFQHVNGTLQIGYGSHGIAVPSGAQSPTGAVHPDEVGIRGAAQREHSPANIPWQRLGPIPLVAFSGHPQASVAAATAFEAIQHSATSHRVPFLPESTVTLALDAGFDAIRMVLADTAVDNLVVAPTAADLATRGLPFTACTACAIVGLPDMPEIDSVDEIAQIVGLPMLITDPAGIVALDADSAPIAALSDYSPCQMVFFSRSAAQLAEQRASGTRVVFCQANQIMGARADSEQVLATLQHDLDLAGQLAAWALWWGLHPDR